MIEFDCVLFEREGVDKLVMLPGFEGGERIVGRCELWIQLNRSSQARLDARISIGIRGFERHRSVVVVREVALRIESDSFAIPLACRFSIARTEFDIPHHFAGANVVRIGFQDGIREIACFLFALHQSEDLGTHCIGIKLS